MWCKLFPECFIKLSLNTPDSTNHSDVCFNLSECQVCVVGWGWELFKQEVDAATGQVLVLICCEGSSEVDRLWLSGCYGNALMVSQQQRHLSFTCLSLACLSLACLSLTCLPLTCLSAGAGESGKSTIVKQMRILHVDGFNAEWVTVTWSAFVLKSHQYFLFCISCVPVQWLHPSEDASAVVK